MNCYENCNQQFKWYQFQARKSCLSGCDVQAYQQNVEQSQESQQVSGRIVFTLILAMAVVTVVFFIAKKKNWI
jgi:heme/copper-type cytochrome/quinol oxidase subunit 2